MHVGFGYSSTRFCSVLYRFQKLFIFFGKTGTMLVTLIMVFYGWQEVAQAQSENYSFDQKSPHIHFTNAPRPITSSPLSSFSFQGWDYHSGVRSYICKLDDGPYEYCESPRSFYYLNPGEHTFRVLAVDQNDNLSSIKTYRWRIERLDSAQLVNRYFFAEGNPGETPSELKDYSAQPTYLDLFYNGSNLRFENSSSGKALRWSGNGNVGAYKELSGSSIPSLLQQASRLTVQASLSIDSCGSTERSIFWIGANTDPGRLALICQNNQIHLWFNERKAASWAASTGSAPEVFSLVIDTSQASLSDRARMYQGDYLLSVSNADLQQNETLNLGYGPGDLSFWIGNQGTGGYPFHGLISYFSIHGTAWSPEQTQTQAYTLEVTDDPEL
jgi:hypothetical protein